MIMKLFKNRKILIATGSILGLLVITQVITYICFAQMNMPYAGIRNLSDYKLLRNMDFAIVESDTWRQLTDSQKRVLSKELLKNVHMVYHSIDEVPNSGIKSRPITDKDIRNYERYKQRKFISSKHLEIMRREVASGRRIIGFRNGIRLRWKLEASGLFWMKCSSSHWVSGTGAEWRSDVYIWILGWWVRIYNLEHAMA